MLIFKIDNERIKLSSRHRWSVSNKKGFKTSVTLPSRASRDLVSVVRITEGP